MGKRPHGITVTLYEKTKSGTDAFGNPIYTETAVEVENVLVGSPSNQEIIDQYNFTGKRLAFVLGIPKGDTHTWTDRRIDFFGQSFKSFGPPLTAIQDLIPLKWGQNIMVEKYE